MLNLYIVKTLNNAHDYFNDLTKESQTRILKHKNINKQQQMITSELLLKYALRDVSYDKEIKVAYLPKIVLLDSNLHISKAHSNDYVLVGVSEKNLGVDIEKIKDIKRPSKLLSEEELDIYNISEDKGRIFTMYWTAKESHVKYHGTLTKAYKEIPFIVDKTISEFNAGKVLELFCYQSYFNGYSFAVVTKEFLAPNIIYVSSNELLGENK